MVESVWCCKDVPWIKHFMLKPKTRWFVDVFPFPIWPYFRFHVDFPGCEYKMRNIYVPCINMEHMTIFYTHVFLFLNLPCIPPEPRATQRGMASYLWDFHHQVFSRWLSVSIPLRIPSSNDVFLGNFYRSQTLEAGHLPVKSRSYNPYKSPYKWMTGVLNPAYRGFLLHI